MTTTGGAERQRLAEDAAGTVAWRRWGAYVSLRQWGTVREDYSADGNAWAHLPFDHARSRAYRWGEDGLAGICDRWQHLCLAVALWNGRDPILKERLFGLANEEGNHGEDVKEHWWPLDATPTHSLLVWRYRYPHAAFPYDRLREENRRRSRQEPEFELLDTGVLDGDRFTDVDVTWAKDGPEAIVGRITCTNRGPEPVTLHVLPTAWLRNTWSWGRDARHARPSLAVDDATGAVRVDHPTLGTRWVDVAGDHRWLTCDNETNVPLLYGAEPTTPYPTDGIGDHVISGAPTVNPDGTGTKAAVWIILTLPPGEPQSVHLRLDDHRPGAPLEPDAVDAVIATRTAEADAWHASLVPEGTDAEAVLVHRRAVAGLIWTQQYYRYHVAEWLEGDPAQPPPPPGREHIRNGAWTHLGNTDIISMPDAWEYPWYAAWDLAFHCVAFAHVDPAFAKDQLILLCREWYMHPSGQLPAYEWAFDDVNPPVHAWAALEVFRRDAAATGAPDFEFLERVFHKLLLNFTWWVNRKDAEGRNVFGGGFLGLDNIGLFDRSEELPGGGRLEQADGTSWMAAYSLHMLSIAVELAAHDPVYEDVATKFFEHYLAIARALSDLGLWDEEDGFFYDVLHLPGREAIPLKVRSVVGLLPLIAATVLEPELLAGLPDFDRRMQWFLRHRPELAGNVFGLARARHHGGGDRWLLSVLSPQRLRRVLARLLDPDEFLSAHGPRTLSAAHAAEPVRLDLDGVVHEVRYEPGDSPSPMFGGNSNWRGPIWFPLAVLLIDGLRTYDQFFGDALTVPHPTGSGEDRRLGAVADDLADRLVGLFLPDADGRRPLHADRPVLDADPHWRGMVTFPEYFHGDSGAGLGASHQTGWTALVATLIARGHPIVSRTPSA
ncbi:glucosidase [Euzebya sp.]|uniref:MGH1-like glycoside hydrolase domain-containing protein n=1 Tax=Euzebya sp. TaxID=1971409 RepID=UPI003519B4EB